MRLPPYKLLFLTLSCCAATAVMAFNFLGAKWSGGRTTFHVAIPGVAPTGQSWSSAFVGAMAQWTALTDFTFEVNTTPLDPCVGYGRNSRGLGFPAGNGDARNSADFGTTVCGNEFGDNVLAITLTLTAPGTLGFDYLRQTDIIFNSKFSWDIYSGPSRSAKDFGRVALHELGHALGLAHENQLASIMASSVGDITTLQPDDLAAASSLYTAPGKCYIAAIKLNSRVDDALQSGDCRIMDLYGGSDDTSYVDVYKFRLEQDSYVNIQMQSTALDSVLIITDASLGDPLIFDDFNGACDARVAQSLRAGDYLLLANTYVVPEKCAGNVGNYLITMTDSTLPILGAVINTNASAQVTPMLFSGGASVDGVNYRSSFSAQELIDVKAQIAPVPAHVGLPGSTYVLATLSNGAQYVKNSAGSFVPFSGRLADMVAYRQGTLAALEKITVVEDLKGGSAGLAGQEIRVYVGYAPASAPNDIYYSSVPIRFSITR